MKLKEIIIIKENREKHWFEGSKKVKVISTIVVYPVKWKNNKKDIYVSLKAV